MIAGIIWTGPKLTPEQAANMLKPNETQFITSYSSEAKIFVVNAREQGPAPKLYHSNSYRGIYGFNQRRVNSPTSATRSTGSKVQVRRTIRSSSSRIKSNK